MIVPRSTRLSELTIREDRESKREKRNDASVKTSSPSIFSKKDLKKTMAIVERVQTPRLKVWRFKQIRFNSSFTHESLKI